jgi:hypothetical protein
MVFVFFMRSLLRSDPPRDSLREKQYYKVRTRGRGFERSKSSSMGVSSLLYSRFTPFFLASPLAGAPSTGAAGAGTVASSAMVIFDGLWWWWMSVRILPCRKPYARYAYLMPALNNSYRTDFVQLQQCGRVIRYSRQRSSTAAVL